MCNVACWIVLFERERACCQEYTQIKTFFSNVLHLEYSGVHYLEISLEEWYKQHSIKFPLSLQLRNL